METNKHLITVDEFKQLTRPTSAHLDEEEVMAYIRECERMYILPVLGYKHYRLALEGSPWSQLFDGTFQASIAYNGGGYSVKECGVEVEKYCDGMKSALAYFVYAKMLKADGTIVSRAGAMRHNDEYASHLDGKEQYNDVMSVAEEYLASTLTYLQHHSKRKLKKMESTRCKIRPIGD